MSDLPPSSPRAPRLPGPEDFPASGPNALGTIGQRALARILDEILVTVPVVVLLMIAAADELARLTDPSATDVNVVTPLWITAVGLVVGVVYETVLIAWRGQTLGKMALGLRVARYADGRRPGVAQAAMRCLVPTTVTVAAAAIGAEPLAPLIYLSVLLNPLLRGWHDLAGGTVVIRTR